MWREKLESAFFNLWRRIYFFGALALVVPFLWHHRKPNPAEINVNWVILLIVLVQVIAALKMEKSRHSFQFKAILFAVSLIAGFLALNTIAVIPLMIVPSIICFLTMPLSGLNSFIKKYSQGIAGLAELFAFLFILYFVVRCVSSDAVYFLHASTAQFGSSLACAAFISRYGNGK